MTELDRCDVCGGIAIVWWPAVGKQWCALHAPEDVDLPHDLDGDDPNIVDVTHDQLTELLEAWRSGDHNATRRAP